MERPYPDRRAAGERLAQALLEQEPALRDPEKAGEVLVLGIPRGGVVVAAVVARALGVPLDVAVACRLGAPTLPEVTVGAVLPGDPMPVIDEEVARAVGATDAYLEEEAGRARAEAERRLACYRGDRPLPAVTGRTVLLIDDGIATGATFRALLAALRRQQPRRLIAAAPVATEDALAGLHALADATVCPATPDPFLAVAVWYESFPQTTDDEVIRLLWEHGSGPPRPAPGETPAAPPPGAAEEALAAREPISEQPVVIPAGPVTLEGLLAVPSAATGAVLFAHGSGSGRHSARNAFVARVLHAAGFATLRFDLLSPAESEDRQNLFDLALLTERLQMATAWLREQPETRGLPIGYYGASTGAAAALRAAAQLPEVVRAVVSRGGRPDLTEEALSQVAAPTRLLVGGNDTPVRLLNQTALARMRCPKELVVVPGASHLFEEAGALEEAARLARDWFARYLARAR